MKRREFIGLIGSAAASWPLAARAQQQTPPLVALIHGGSPNTLTSYAAAFRNGLGEAGFTEGRNVAVEYHWMEGHLERLPALFADLIRRRVAVIATPGATDVARAARAATTTIPIVFGVAEDPVALSLVASLARPGGNATGVNFFSFEINAKRLGLMHELLPQARRIAVLVNPVAVSSTEAVLKALKEAAPTLGLDIAFFKANTADQIDATFAAFARERPGALFIAGDGFFASRFTQLATLATRERIPASFSTRAMVGAGLLMCYGADIVDTFRQVGVYSGNILKGAKPSDLPVLQPTKFEFVINLKAARALGIEVPPMLLARADEVIE
jgi:putative ABC transport system substrate-binding protein